MVAMMLPAVAPLVLLFSKVARSRAERGQPYVPTALFISGYFAVWSGRDCPMGLACRRAAFTSDDRQKYNSLWPTLCWCRLIPVFTSQKFLPQSLSIAVNVFADRMAQRPDRCLSDGMETRPVLHRVLLAANAPTLRSGRHESSLDCAARYICFVGARRTQTLVFGASIRFGSGRVRNMDALFAANRRVITKAAGDTEVPAWTKNLTQRRKGPKVLGTIFGSGPAAAGSLRSPCCCRPKRSNEAIGMVNLRTQSPPQTSSRAEVFERTGPRRLRFPAGCKPVAPFGFLG